MGLGGCGGCSGDFGGVGAPGGRCLVWLMGCEGLGLLHAFRGAAYEWSVLHSCTVLGSASRL